MVSKRKFSSARHRRVRRRPNPSTTYGSLNQKVKMAKMRRRRNMKKIRRGLGIESKEIISSFTVNVAGNSAGSTTFTPDDATFQVDPNASTCNIIQGVAENQRIGNKIRLTYGTCKCVISPRSAANPQIVRVICFYDKRYPTATPTPFANGDFFEANAVGGTTFSGGLDDIYNEINRDRYRVFWERTYKVGFADYSGSSVGDPAYAFQTNNDFKMFVKKTYSLSKTCVKSLNYKDTDVTPNWRGCWIMAFSVAAAGSANTNNQQTCNLRTQIRWRYTDA